MRSIGCAKGKSLIQQLQKTSAGSSLAQEPRCPAKTGSVRTAQIHDFLQILDER